MRKALSIIMMLSLLPLAGCSASADQRIGEADGYGGKVRVSVTMNGTDITEVEVIEHSETPGVGTRAIEALPDQIVQADSIDVDSISGATVTSEAIKQAVGQAMGMAGMMQQVIPMDGMNASEASSTRGRMGMGMAVNGRIGPGKDDEGNQVYSMNVVFASGEFDEDGVIRAIRVDQLELVTPNLGGGNMFSGFPQEAAGEEAFLQEVSAWQTKGMMGDDYMLQSGSWRQEMDAYEQMMVGKTVDEVKEWYQNRATGTGSSAGSDTADSTGTAAGSGTAGGTGAADGSGTIGGTGTGTGTGSAAENGTATGNGTAAETDVTDASDAGAAQMVHDMADVDMTGAGQADAASSATMSLQGEYGDILLAIERAWEDAKGSTQGEG